MNKKYKNAKQKIQNASYKTQNAKCKTNDKHKILNANGNLLNAKIQKSKLFTSAVAACVAGWSVVPILFAHLLTVPENKHFRLYYNFTKTFQIML